MKNYNQLNFKSLISLYQYLVSKKNILQDNSINYALNIEINNLNKEIDTISKMIIAKVDTVSLREIIIFIEDNNELGDLSDMLLYTSIMNVKMYDIRLLGELKRIVSKISFDMLYLLVCDCRFDDMKEIFLDQYMKIIDNSFKENVQDLLEKESVNNEYKRKRTIEYS